MFNNPPPHPKIVPFIRQCIKIGTIKRTIFRKVRTETILKIYNTLIVPTFLNWSENWTVTASQRRRIEAAEMKLLRPLAGCTLHDHKIKDFISREVKITGILDRIDEYRLNWHLHLQRMPQKPNPVEIIPLQTTRKENNWKTEETLARTVVNSGDGTDQTGPIFDVYDDVYRYCRAGRPQLTIWRMRIACRITEATDTH